MTPITGELLAVLLLKYTPELIQRLVAVWSKPQSPEEIKAILDLAQKDYDAYLNAARERANG